MPSFITSHWRNVDRLLALLLLWNVAAGAFVTLGAPWLSEMAGTTALRPALPAGRGWLAIGAPTHFAGLWLPVIGGYALYRMRRHLQWHLVAVLFYAPQTLAIMSPVHVDMWMGLFATASFERPSGLAIAFNGVAITLVLAHAGSEFRASLQRTAAAVLGLCRAFLGTARSRSEQGSAAVRNRARDVWGATALSLSALVPPAVLSVARGFLGTPPLTRSALSRRYASIATITAVIFLPLLPRDIFYPGWPASQFVEPHWFDKETVMLWRKLLLLPMTFVIAYVMAFAWSGSQRAPRFSAQRGLVAAMLSYVYLGMAIDLLSRWLSDGQEPWFRYFAMGFIFLMPWTLLVPVIGAATGDRLGRKITATPESAQRGNTPLTAGMWLTLVTPLLALLLSYALDAPKRDQIDAARIVAQRALDHFDQNAPEQLYAMFPADAQARIDRDAFIATLRERRDSLGELQDSDARDEVRHDWYPGDGIVHFGFNRAGSRGDSNESIVIDVREATPTLSAVFMSFDGQPPAHNIYVPPHRACLTNDTDLYCGGWLRAHLAACSNEEQAHERNITSNVVIVTPSAQNAE